MSIMVHIDDSINLELIGQRFLWYMTKKYVLFQTPSVYTKKMIQKCLNQVLDMEFNVRLSENKITYRGIGQK